MHRYRHLLTSKTPQHNTPHHITSRQGNLKFSKHPSTTHRLHLPALNVRVLFLSVVHVCTLITSMQLYPLKYVITHVFVIINTKLKGHGGFFVCLS